MFIGRASALIVGMLTVLAAGCASSTTVDGDAAATTVEGVVEGLLTVTSPEIGDVFPSPSNITGESSSPTVSYVLSAGGMVIAEGTIDVIDRKFSTTVEFTNTCCIEMTLEVLQPDDTGSTLVIPLASPEPG